MLPVTSTPGMLTDSVRSVILKLLSLGIRDVVGFDYVDPPAPESILRAVGELREWYVD